VSQHRFLNASQQTHLTAEECEGSFVVDCCAEDEVTLHCGHAALPYMQGFQPDDPLSLLVVQRTR
jgi:hypothetical protein